MDELDKLILEDLENHVPWSVIAKNRHVSPNTIAEVKKKYSSSQASTSEAEVDARAFQLFEEEKDPVQVTIELKQPPQLVQELYNLYIEMKESSKKIKEERLKKLKEERSKELEERYYERDDDAVNMSYRFG